MTEEVIFHDDHYSKVRRARAKLNLPEFNDLYPEHGRIFDHPLEGKKIFNKIKQKEYIIQSVHKHWYKGWYYMILAYHFSETTSELLTTDIIDGKTYGRSHAPLFWENISCIDKTMLKCIEETRIEYDTVGW